jgi:hypothetical protein
LGTAVIDTTYIITRVAVGNSGKRHHIITRVAVGNSGKRHCIITRAVVENSDKRHYSISSQEQQLGTAVSINPIH